MRKARTYFDANGDVIDPTIARQRGRPRKPAELPSPRRMGASRLWLTMLLDALDAPTPIKLAARADDARAMLAKLNTHAGKVRANAADRKARAPTLYSVAWQTVGGDAGAIEGCTIEQAAGHVGVTVATLRAQVSRGKGVRSYLRHGDDFSETLLTVRRVGTEHAAYQTANKT